MIDAATWCFDGCWSCISTPKSFLFLGVSVPTHSNLVVAFNNRCTRIVDVLVWLPLKIFWKLVKVLYSVIKLWNLVVALTYLVTNNPTEFDLVCSLCRFRRWAWTKWPTLTSAMVLFSATLCYRCEPSHSSYFNAISLHIKHWSSFLPFSFFV